VFDATGVRRGLVEWYTSDAARESAKLLLAPLDHVDSRSRNTAIRTLAAYLDSNGSLARAGDSLHVHRNAVAYRVKRALDLLQVTLEDPEQRLMLHLACRAELLSIGTHELG
jgi:DNA-binding PucR family transcriptional regulator